jgi:hypothetical protein
MLGNLKHLVVVGLSTLSVGLILLIAAPVHAPAAGAEVAACGKSNPHVARPAPAPIRLAMFDAAVDPELDLYELAASEAFFCYIH